MSSLISVAINDKVRLKHGGAAMTVYWSSNTQVKTTWLLNGKLVYGHYYKRVLQPVA